MTYTLAGLDNRETGWGVAGETWAVMDELGRLGGENWFRLGDRDLATHLFRTGRLAAGEPLSEVTAESATRRGRGGAVAAGDRRPAADPGHARRDERAGPGTEVGFQDYFVRLPRVPVSRVRFEGVRRGPAARGPRGTRRAGSHRGVPVEPDRLHRPGARGARAWWRRCAPAATTWWPSPPIVAGAA